ncbi:MAG: hypothetical protein ACLPXB_00980 [Thiobacillaceae bacterium]
MKGKSLDEILQVTPPKREMPEGEELGTSASRAVPRGWPAILVLNGREDTRAFQYVHLGFANYSADGRSFVVEFNEPEKWRMTVKGSNLWKVFANIQQHALEWIKKADRDFADGDTPVITEIKIERVTEGDSH